MTVKAISIPENFDSANAFDFRSVLNVAAETVIVDFKNTCFVDSAGIGTLVYWLRAMQGSGGKLVFVRLSGQPRDIIEMVGLDKLVEIRNTEAA
jgi:anti-anti-sigma factor